MRGVTTPKMKAPKIACTPITSVIQAEMNTMTSMTTMTSCFMGPFASFVCALLLRVAVLQVRLYVIGGREIRPGDKGKYGPDDGGDEEYVHQKGREGVESGQRALSPCDGYHDRQHDPGSGLKVMRLILNVVTKGDDPRTQRRRLRQRRGRSDRLSFA